MRYIALVVVAVLAVGACTTDEEQSIDSAIAAGDTVVNVSSTTFKSDTWSFRVGPNCMGSDTAGIIVGGFPMHAGDVARSLLFQLGGTGTATFAIKMADASMVERVIGFAQVATTGPWKSAALDITDTVVPQIGGLSVIVTADSAGVSLGNIGVVYTPAVL